MSFGTVKPDSQPIDELRHVQRILEAAERIRDFLAITLPLEIVTQENSAERVAGQWLSRIQGLHGADDFLLLVQDYLQYLMANGEPSQASDALSYYFSGFLPNYGVARTFVQMVYERQIWPEIKAYLHRSGYGDVQSHVDNFDWKGGQKKSDFEHGAWLQILKNEHERVVNLSASKPILLAFQRPTLPDSITKSPTPPKVFNPPPVLELPPINGNPPTIPAAPRFRIPWSTLPKWPIFLALLLTPKNFSEEEQQKVRDIDDVWGRYRKDGKLPVFNPKTQTQTVDSNTTNNDCKAQTAENQKNGAECENSGYLIMEGALFYKRLINPPKGKGLDGLFEKLAPHSLPVPFPETIVKPSPGKLIFLPPTSKPPAAQYDYTGKPPQITYPKFVVFEGKHIAKPMDPQKDEKGVLQEAKNRLKNTCDGKQMGEDWTENRIPNALKRDTASSPGERRNKEKEILRERYANWVFVCLPSIGNQKIFTLIDASSASGWEDLNDPKYKKLRQPRATGPKTTF